MRRSSREPDRSDLGTVTSAYPLSAVILERLFESGMIKSEAGWRSCVVLKFELGQQSGSGSGKQPRMMSAHSVWITCVYGTAAWPKPDSSIGGANVRR